MRRSIRPHQHHPVLRIQLRMHDQVTLAWILAHAVLAERADRKIAAERSLVELHRFAGLRPEAQVGIEGRCHRSFSIDGGGTDEIQSFPRLVPKAPMALPLASSRRKPGP